MCVSRRDTVDYILFATKDVDLDINPNEVSDARYVTESELKTMFENEDGRFKRCPLLLVMHILTNSNVRFVLLIVVQPNLSRPGSSSFATTCSSPGGDS